MSSGAPVAAPSQAASQEADHHALEAAAPTAHFIARQSCPGCDQARFETLHRQSYLEPRLWGFLSRYYGQAISAASLAGAEYRLERCVACSLVFQHSVPNGQFLTTLYDEWLNAERHPEQNPVDRAAMARPLAARDGHEILTIARVLNEKVTDLRVLDYGMGWGLWPRIALRLGVREVCGFDLSHTRVEYARQQGIRIVSGSEISGLELDFINADQVFEHLTTPHEDAIVLASGLRRGGILKIAVPRAPGLRHRLRRLDWDAPKKGRHSLNAVHPLEHLNCWSARSLDALAARVGLEVIQPSIRAQLAFLSNAGSLRWHDPQQVAKSLLRVPYNRWSQNNLYRWYRRP